MLIALAEQEKEMSQDASAGEVELTECKVGAGAPTPQVPSDRAINSKFRTLEYEV